MAQRNKETSMRMRGIGGGLLLLLSLTGIGAAQGLNERCKLSFPNRQGTPAGTPIVVGVAAVTVIAPSTRLCKAVVTNMSQLDSIMCRQAGTDPTATTGFEVLPYQVFSLDQDAQIGLKCIRSSTAGADVTVTVMEYEP
jgi:hypothetical protein